jgi:hypothetical protein
MIYFQIFHQILFYFFEKKDFWKKKIFYETFKISENIIISVELAQVLQ